jgi:hypothetical protein
MPVSIKGTGGGSVTLSAAAAATDTTLTLPNTTGTLLQSGTAVTVAQGGTGAATLAANNVLLGNGTSALQVVAPGTSGNALVSNGTTWTSAAAPSPAALSTASGSAPSYSARAWVNFNGISGASIRASANVSSVTYNGTGDYTVTLTTALSDANGAVVATGGRYSTGSLLAVQGVNAYLTSSSTARMVSGSDSSVQSDNYDINVAFFR